MARSTDRSEWRPPWAAVDRLQAAGVRPARPLGLAVFPEEEGSRFGIACLGSRLLTGDIVPERAAVLTDPDGVTFADTAARHGLDPHHLGPDRQALDRIGVFLELHVEQGRGLIDLGQPVAIGTSIRASCAVAPPQSPATWSRTTGARRPRGASRS